MKYVEIDNHKMHVFAAGDEIKQQKILLKRNAMNPCYENEAEAISENAEIVNKGGRIECPILMFISDGKQVSSGWIDHERKFAALMDAKTVYLNCGHCVLRGGQYVQRKRVTEYEDWNHI